MTVTAARLSATEMYYDGVSGDAFKFIATGEWIVNPFFEYTDCIGISWSDEFTLYYDSGYSYSENPGGIPFYNYDALTLNDMSPEEGFAYDADLNPFDRQDEITIIGKVYQPDSSGSANVVATYGHVITRPSSVEVSFNSGKEIGMSVGFASAIEMASPDYKYFNY